MTLDDLAAVVNALAQRITQLEIRMSARPTPAPYCDECRGPCRAGNPITYTKGNPDGNPNPDDQT